MRGRRAFVVTVLALCALLPRLVPAQSQTHRYANVTYRLPAGWKVDKGYEYLPYCPDPKSGIPAVRMTISRPDYSRGKYFIEAVNRISGILSDPSVIDMDGPREVTLAGGITGILASAVRFQGLENSGAYRGDLAAVIDLGDKFQVITVESADVDAFQKAKAGAEQLIASMVFDPPVGTASQTPPQVTLEGVDKAPEDIPYPLSTISTSDMDAAAEAAANAVKAGGKDAFPALVFAAVQSGFTIRNSKNGIVKYPASGKGNGYSMTAIELILYDDLQQSGFTMELDSLCRELGTQFSRIFDNVKIDLRSGLLHGLSAAASSKQKPVRFMARFLAALGRNSAAPYDLLAGNPPKDARLDAVQALFIMRASIGQVTAATALHLAEGTGRSDPLPTSPVSADPYSSGPFLSDSHAESASISSSAAGLQAGDASGTVEDAAVGATTGVVGETLNVIEGELDKAGKTGEAEKVGDKLGKLQKLNSTLSVIKFIATYACLKAEFELSGGAKKDVLERTKDTKPGEEKNVKVKFSLDTAKWMQLMKDYRMLLAVAFKGVDFDMPKAGPLSGNEVEWTMPETDRKNLAKNLAYLEGEKDAEGKSNFRRSVTDTEGRSAVKLIGQPQVEDMKKFSVVPVRKSALVQATIQIKRPTAGQDIVDAGLAAWGIFPVSGLTPKATGNEGTGWSAVLPILTPIMETFYRMKCLAPKSVRVPVIDWEFAGYLVDVSVYISGSGQKAKPEQKGSFRWGVSRQLDVEGIVMGGDKFPVLDPEVVKLLDFKQPTVRNFAQFGAETAGVKVKDFTVEDGEEASCIDPKKKERFVKREDWTAPPAKPTHARSAIIDGVRVTFDMVKNVYYISLPGIGTAAAMTEITYSQSYQSGNRAPEVTGPSQYFTTLFFSIKSDNPSLTGSLGPTVEQPLPPIGPDNKFPVIEGRKTYTNVTRVPFGKVIVGYSWRIEPVQGKTTEARRTRTWDPWRGIDLAGPHAEEVEEGRRSEADDPASCHPMAFSVRPLPETITASGTNAPSVIRPPAQGAVPAGNKPGTE